jgi:hypothetical protein
MPRKIPSKEKLAEFREFMNGMMAVRLDVLSANATRYAETLGAIRAALVKAGFSSDESMQIVLQIAEQRGRRPMHGGERGSHWQK